MVGVLTAFGFFTNFDFFGVTLTVTKQFPGAKATSLPPETLQIFFDALETLSTTLDPGVTETPA